LAVTQYAPGKIKAILYFINAQGTVKMLPTDEESHRFRGYMKKLGFEMMFAESLHEARKLQKKLQEQLAAEQANELIKDEVATSGRREAIRVRLNQKLHSNSTSETEKEFIRLWLVMREDKHNMFRRRFTQQIGHLDALEFDNPNKHIHDLLDKT
jgi:hypothetical protein